MVISKTYQQGNLTINKERVDQVNKKYKYLETIVNGEIESSVEIKTRIGQVRITINEKTNVFCLSGISLNLKKVAKMLCFLNFIIQNFGLLK